MQNQLSFTDEIKILIECDKLRFPLKEEHIIKAMLNPNESESFILYFLRDKIYRFINFILNEKITVAVLGKTNSGKSTFLNSLIGKEILEKDTQECTYFGTKINTSSKKNNLKFYEQSHPKISFNNLEEIKRHIVSINKEQREKKHNANDIWILETEIQAFSRAKTFDSVKDIYEYIEFIDLPGIDDHDEDSSALDAKFSNILEKVDIDAFIILIDYKYQDQIKKMCDIFRAHLFKGKKKSKLQKILCDKNFLIVVNKYEPQDCQNLDQKKKEFKDLILYKFFIPKETNIFKNFFQISKKEEEDTKKFLKFSDKDYEAKAQNFQVIFVSSKEAQSQEIEEIIKNERKELQEVGLSEEEIEDEINKLKEEKFINPIYNEKSNFEELVTALAELFNRIGEKKIIDPLRKFKDLVLNARKIDLKYKDTDCDLKLSFKVKQQEISDLFDVIEMQIIELLKPVLNIANSIMELSCDMVSETISLILKLLEIIEKLEDTLYKNKEAVQSKIENSNIYLISESIFNYDLDPLTTIISMSLFDFLLECVLPENFELVYQTEFFKMMRKLKTKEEKDAFAVFFTQMIKKTSSKSAENKKSEFLLIYKKFEQHITVYQQTIKLKIDKLLTEYKKTNEIN